MEKVFQNHFWNMAIYPIEHSGHHIEHKDSNCPHIISSVSCLSYINNTHNHFITYQSQSNVILTDFMTIFTPLIVFPAKNDSKKMSASNQYVKTTSWCPVEVIGGPLQGAPNHTRLFALALTSDWSELIFPRQKISIS